MDGDIARDETADNWLAVANNERRFEEALAILAEGESKKSKCNFKIGIKQLVRAHFGRHGWSASAAPRFWTGSIFSLLLSLSMRTGGKKEVGSLLRASFLVYP